MKKNRTHSQQAEVLEGVAMEASEEISDAQARAVAEPPHKNLNRKRSKKLSRMSRRSRKAGVEGQKRKHLR